MRQRPLLSALCAALLWVWLATLAQAATPASGPAATEAQLKQVRQRIEAIRSRIQADAQRRDALAGQLRNADLKVQSARERLSEVRARRAAAEKRLAELKVEQAQTERQIAAQREALAGELAAAYMNGRQEPLKLLLNQEDPSQIGRVTAYYGYLTRARAERLTAIDERLEHLRLLTDSIAAETQRLRESEAEQAQGVAALSDARARRAETLAQLKSQLKTRSGELAKLQRDARALEQLLEELRRAIEEFPELAEQPFQRVKGKLPWPVKGKLLARFGQLRAGGPLRWQGVVIGVTRGAQVRAPFHGRVVYADWLPGLGMLVVLDHGGGYMSLYGHNEQLYRRVGERVAPGDLLGIVGEASGLAQPGLYFEIRQGKRPLDPTAWLTKS